jgi:hypothetical protein
MAIKDWQKVQFKPLDLGGNTLLSDKPKSEKYMEKRRVLFVQ